MKIKKSNNCNLTSFYGDTFKATANEIERKFGKPAYAFYGEDEKTTYEWELELEDGTPFTIYDWKEFWFTDNSKIEWHIGANNAEDSHKVKAILDKINFNK